MDSLSNKTCGTLTLGGDLVVNRLGYGALHITGKQHWGEPENREDAIKLLRRLPELGIQFIDTADAYGPYVSESFIAEALAPYEGLVVATKGGLTRPSPDVFKPVGHPDYLRQCIRMSLRRLGVERIDLWQLHRIDPNTDRNRQFEVIAEMQKEGFIRHVGLSEVSVDDIRAARKYFPVVSVQNLYNLVNRQSEAVLDYCEKEQIAFIPWFPLAAGGLAQKGGVLEHVAKRLGANPAQVALAWMLKRSRVMLPIPGTRNIKHLEENIAAAELALDDEDFRQLDELGQQEWKRTQSELHLTV